MDKIVSVNIDYIPAEGRWIKNYKQYNCSLCGKIALSIQYAHGYETYLSDYCPHCGKKLR